MHEDLPFDADDLNKLVCSLDSRASIECGEIAVDPALDLMRDAATWLIERGSPLWALKDITRERILGEAGSECCWCLRIDGEPAAAAMLTWYDPAFWPDIPAGASGFIHKLAVGRRWHGRGLANLMLVALERVCLQRDVYFLRLDCAADRLGLTRFYEQVGFVQVDRRLIFGRFDSAFYLKTLHPDGLPSK